MHSENVLIGNIRTPVSMEREGLGVCGFFLNLSSTNVTAIILVTTSERVFFCVSGGAVKAMDFLAMKWTPHQGLL